LVLRLEIPVCNKPVFNNPANYRDPKSQCPRGIIGAIGGALGALLEEAITA
jgi:hypothetical protein